MSVEQSLKIGDVRVIFDKDNKVKGFSVSEFTLQYIAFLSRMTFFNPIKAVLPEKLQQITEKVFSAIYQIDSVHRNKTLSNNFADAFFGILANFWEMLLETGRLDDAKHYLQEICSVTTKWENRNIPARIHKGTPYFFLARTFRMQGDIESTFPYAYSAVEEDIKSFGPEYKNAPAYMYASLVDNPNNVMYDYVHQMKTKIEGYVQEYQKALQSPFSYADFETKFLQSTMEDVKHFFVYNLELLIKYESIPTNIFQNDFSKIKSLDTIFNLCLIVDKILEKRFHKRTIGGNVIEMIAEKGWGRIPEKNKETFSQLLSFNPNSDPPDKVVPLLLANQATYDNQPMSKAMSLIVLVWYLRNYGGHHIKAQNVLITSFQDIIKAIMYALFISVEILNS